MSDVNTLVFQPLQQFVKNSVHLVKKCTKPDRKGASLPFHPEGAGVGSRSPCCETHTLTLSFRLAEFTRIAAATSVGFLMMGFIGFFVKLVHIPINNILVGGSA